MEVATCPAIFRHSANPRHALPPHRVLDDACTVCGKPATGTHYQCVSCNGCRSFFRRSVAYGKDYTCKGMGYDQQGCFTRHRCKRCRMAMCLAAGMNPEAVRVDEDEDASPGALPEDLSVTDIVPIVPDYECKLEKMMQKLLLIEDAHHKLRVSKYSPRLVPGLSIDDFAYGPSKLGVDYGPMRATPYEPVSIMLVPEEVYIKHKIQIDFSRFDYSERKLWMFQDVTFAIEFIKALPIYHLLDDCSKFALLGSAITCSNFTSAFYSYSHHSDRTCFPDGSVMSWSRTLQDESPHSTRFHTGLIAAMRDVQLDTREYALLKMIVVCNPLLDGLNPYDVTLLQHEKERYTKTLLSYVLAKRGIKDGPAMFSKILSIVNVAMKLTSWQKIVDDPLFTMPDHGSVCVNVGEESQHILILAMGLHKYSCPFAETIFHSH